MTAIQGVANSVRRRSSTRTDEYKLEAGLQNDSWIQPDATNEELLEDGTEPSKMGTCVLWMFGDKVFVNRNVSKIMLRDLTRTLVNEGYEFQKYFHMSAQVKNTWSAKLKGYPFETDSSGIFALVIKSLELAGYKFVTCSESFNSTKFYFVPASRRQ
jgi:hypothetical protein